MANSSGKRRFERFTPTEKSRAEWFFRRFAFPLRDAPPLELERFWEQQHRYDRARGVVWEEAGPTNYAGRVTSLIVDPHNDQVLFAGSAAGGVWYSKHGGE